MAKVLKFYDVANEYYCWNNPVKDIYRIKAENARHAVQLKKAQFRVRGDEVIGRWSAKRVAE